MSDIDRLPNPLPVCQPQKQIQQNTDLLNTALVNKNTNAFKNQLNKSN
jgi:hypothetical protein